MKRFLSLFLVLCTLLCLFPVAISAVEGGEDLAPEATATYVDLYAKDGLVALFDGYSMTEGSDALTSWTPVNLYGVPGYEDYLAPAAQPLTTGRFTWKSGDGYLALIPTNGESSDYDAWMKLDATLSAALKGNFTVQEIYKHDSIQNSAWLLEIDEENKTVTT